MKKEHVEIHNNSGSNLKDIILGGQDGLVNVLGVILGVAAATFDTRIIIVAGLAATFAESISMAAVAYTSTKAAQSYYLSQLKKEEQEIKEMPKLEKGEIYDIYYKKGFRGKVLNDIVKTITGSKKIWLETMMVEELGMLPREYSKPGKSAFIVGLSAIIGSVIPLISFFIFPVSLGIIIALILSALALFITGTIKAKLTVGNEFRSGLEMLIIGMVAALTGYLVGYLFGNINF
ncbi:MAG: VIT1/CCC1 transporter family protein [Nanoarchaeota archaeon]